MKFSCLFIYKNKRTLLTKFSRNLLFVCLSSGEGREDDFFLAIEVSSLVTFISTIGMMQCESGQFMNSKQHLHKWSHKKIFLVR